MVLSTPTDSDVTVAQRSDTYQVLGIKIHRKGRLSHLQSGSFSMYRLTQSLPIPGWQGRTDSGGETGAEDKGDCVGWILGGAAWFRPP